MYGCGHATGVGGVEFFIVADEMLPKFRKSCFSKTATNTCLSMNSVHKPLCVNKLRAIEQVK